MTRLTLKSLAARPLRTALTTLAIVLGVALVERCAHAHRHAAQGRRRPVVGVLRRHRRRRQRQDRVQDRRLARTGACSARRSTPRCSSEVRDGARASAWPSATSPTRTPRSSARTASRSATARTSASASTPARRAPSSSRRSACTTAAGPPARAEVVIDQKTAEDQGYARRRPRQGQPAAARPQPFEIVGVAQLRRRSSRSGTATVRGVRPADRPGAVRQGRRLRRRSSSAAREGTSGAQVRAALTRELGPRRRVQHRGRARPLHVRRAWSSSSRSSASSCSSFGGVAILVGALTIINSLSITLAQRTRELGLLRLVGAEPPPGHGAGRRRGARHRPARLDRRPRPSATCSRMGLQALFASMGLDLPDAGTVFDAGTVVVVAARRHASSRSLAGHRPGACAPRASRRSWRCATPSAGSRKVGIVGRVDPAASSRCSAVRPRSSAASAGLLARRNALRQPGRTAATAGALTVGVALVTVVAVLAAGPARHDERRARAARRRRRTSSSARTAGRRPTRRRRRRSREAPGVEAVDDDPPGRRPRVRRQRARQHRSTARQLCVRLRRRARRRWPSSAATARSSTRAGRTSTA